MLNWTAEPFLKSVVDCLEQFGEDGNAVKDGMGLVMVKLAAN